jgi:SAM-dependent methyltransferase
VSTKHDALTEADMQRFRMNPTLLAQLRAHAGSRAPGPVRILDWGRGRGRAVAFLRQEGFEAFGVDIDRAVLRNGHELFRARGFDPERLLRPLDDIGAFGDGTFDIVFSEETLEHVANLAQVARESFRLLRPGGLAVHSFPGSRWLVEPHVHMPLAHWLAPGKSRRLLIRAWLLLGFGPRPPWPEAGGGLGRQVDVYDRYLAEKTAYRPREEVMAAFARAGFLGRWLGDAPATGWRRLLPAALRDNGFPAGHLLLRLVKPA